MCSQSEKHIHVLRDDKQKVTICTACSDCFRDILKNPDLFSVSSNQK